METIVVVVALIVGALVLLWRRSRSRRDPWVGRQYRLHGDDDRPEGSRFASWEEAFNRPAPAGLRYWIEYADKDGVVTEREIEPKSIHLLPREPEIFLRAYCHLRREERTFHTSRVIQATNLKTGRQISNLAGHLRRLC